MSTRQTASGSPLWKPSPADMGWLADMLRRVQPGMDVPDLPDQIEPAWAVAASACGLTPWELAERIARLSGLRSEPLPPALGQEAVAWSRSPIAQEYNAVQLRHGEGFLVVAVSNPTQSEMAQRLQFVTGAPVEIVIAPPADIRKLKENHGLAAAGLAGVPGPTEDWAETDLHDDMGEFRVDDTASDSAVVRLCNMMLRQAMESGASDVHVQPMGNVGIVRMRIDGLLHKMGRLPLSVMTRLIGRVKAVAGMDPTDRMRPQDGHARAVSREKTLDLRIATLPVAGGEKLVIRLLGGNEVRRLEDMGLPVLERRQIQNLVDASMGMVLVTGPTGSGKTTTLYGVLAEKNTTQVNIVTVEDPVEIRMPRLAQAEVNPRAGLSFASALRSVVRQDPDIILIGEIRDGETAGIAMQAAITGHLVLASVHANDAVSVMPRLTELGVSRDLVAEAVRGVVSQRLVRAVCPACTRKAAAPFTRAEAWLRQHAGVAESVRAVGCRACSGTGYRGRLGIMQILTNSPEVSRLLDHGAPLSEVRALARAQGMRFLAESALDRIKNGQTTLEEALRVLGVDFWHEIAAVCQQEPPPDVVESCDAEAPADDRGAVLLIMKDDARRHAFAAWLDELGWRRVEASSETEVREAMERNVDFSLAIVDIEGLLEDRVRALLAMRASLAGWGIPLLAFRSGQQALEEHIAQQAHAALVPRPERAEQLQEQIEQALSG